MDMDPGYDSFYRLLSYICDEGLSSEAHPVARLSRGHLFHHDSICRGTSRSAPQIQVPKLNLRPL
jgi:hypothetical protein